LEKQDEQKKKNLSKNWKVEIFKKKKMRKERKQVNKTKQNKKKKTSLPRGIGKTPNPNIKKAKPRQPH
jgi:hypothetical protein